jgi:hypothetical protein
MVLAYLFLGFLLMVGLVAAARWLVAADPAVLARAVRILAVGCGVAGVLLLIFYGRGGLVLTAVALMLPLGMRWLARRQRLRAAAGPSPAQASRVETATLEMILDHDSGRMSGRVRAGRFQGRNLNAMTLEELRELLADCAETDPQSVALLEAYLDREHGSAWREAADAAAGGGAPPRGGMTESEALQVLGLKPGASREEIKEAYRQLLLKLHPDHGGSSYLAAQIIRARDILLGSSS